MKDLEIVREISPRDVLLLRKLPGVRQRNIDIDRVLDRNELFAIRNIQSNRLLLITFYHDFGSFIYGHTTIGKDVVKRYLAYPYYQHTTRRVPSYSIQFYSEESIRSIERVGGRRIRIEEMERAVPDFMEKVNDLTGTRLYKSEGLLLDKNDAEIVDNPIYVVTKETLTHDTNGGNHAI